MLYRHRRFVSLLGSTERRATDILKTIKTELVWNPILTTDFRAVAYALIRLGGHARLAIGQHWDGCPTRVEWGNDRLVLPTVPDHVLDGFPDVSGSVVSVAGLTGAIRGQSSTLASGEVIRPEFVILDDPSTRRSAMSPTQCQARLELINSDVLAMAGPDSKIAAVACLTPIRAGDLADVLLDRDRSPRWHGERCKLLDSLPTDEKRWAEYARLRAEDLRRGGNGSVATAYYLKNQEPMDLGASAPWPARFLPDEVSAIQSAMNLKLDYEVSFMSEYQGEPMRPDLSDSVKATPELIASKTNGIPCGVLPVGAEFVTGMIDVHDAACYWCVCGWSPRFDGWICDYGTWPEQNLRYFSLRKLTNTLAAKYPGTGREGAIRAGLMDLTAALCSREFRREDGAVMRIGRLLVDAGYMPDVVYDVCAHSPHAAVLLPSRGEGIGASRLPISEYDRKRGDHIGNFWWIPKPGDKRAQRHFRTDTNHYNTFVHARFMTALGDPGSLSLWGHDQEEHRHFAAHCVAEVPIKTYGQGRCVDEWKTLPGQDQHWFDCIVSSAAAASYLGAALDGTGAVKPVKLERKRIRASEIIAQKREKFYAGGTGA